MIKLSLPIVSDAFSMARESLKSQRLRAILTALIIAIGITALVGMLTAISVMENSLTGQFTSMGANTFTVQSGGMRIQIGSNGIQQKRQQAIPLRTAKRLAQRVSEKGMVGSVSDDVSGTSTIQYLDRKTNPNVRVMASDGNFMV
ncbi:MAG: ABC transporter permease, partial [Schleiferiaceae bacterium]|nr:ABC transporter permease [Schleiferiaceae bacterium]